MYEFLDSELNHPIIVNTYLGRDKTEKLLVMLKRYLEEIGYTINDLKGINPSVCMYKILLERDSKPLREHQRRLDPNMSEVVKKEVLKLLGAGIIYHNSDSKWVSPVHVVLKKGGMIMVKKEKWDSLATRGVTRRRIRINYKKLNKATRKDHFPISFIDQMLERLAKNSYLFYLYGYSGLLQIPIHLSDQENTIFTCPKGTFSYRWVLFGLCNAPATFQICMISIFDIFLEDIMEVFMDDFSVCGSSFEDYLHNLERVLERCVKVNLMLNWENAISWWKKA